MYSVLIYSVNYLRNLNPRLFAHDERGVTTIEYGILAAGLAIIIATLVSSDGGFSTTLEKVFNNILDQLPQQSSNGTGGTQ